MINTFCHGYGWTTELWHVLHPVLPKRASLSLNVRLYTVNETTWWKPKSMVDAYLWCRNQRGAQRGLLCHFIDKSYLVSQLFCYLVSFFPNHIGSYQLFWCRNPTWGPPMEGDAISSWGRGFWRGGHQRQHKRIASAILADGHQSGVYHDLLYIIHPLE